MFGNGEERVHRLHNGIQEHPENWTDVFEEMTENGEERMSSLEDQCRCTLKQRNDFFQQMLEDRPECLYRFDQSAPDPLHHLHHERENLEQSLPNQKQESADG